MKKSKRLISLMAVSLVLSSGLFLVASCQGGETPVVKDIEVTSIELSSEKKSVEIGKTLKLTTKVLPTDATNQSVTYVSSNPSILTVSNDGTVTGIALGSSVVTATSESNNKVSSINISVIKEGYESYDVSGISEELVATPYTNKVSGYEKYGLSEVDNVGVSLDETSKLYYDIPALSENDVTINVASLSLSDIKKVIPEATEVNGYYSLQASLLLAKQYNAEGKKVKISLSEGVINVNANLSSNYWALMAEDLKDTYIEGNNTVINIQIADLNYKGYLKVSNCTNFYLKDVTFKEEVPANLTGSVIAYDLENNKITLSINKEFNELVERVKKTKKTIRTYVEFGKNTKAPLQDGNLVVDNFSGYEISGDAENGYSIVVSFKEKINESALGTLGSLQFAQYDASGINIGDSKDVYLENLVVNNAYGMALVAGNVENLYVNRFNLKVSEGSSSLMTSCADAMHFVSMSGDVKVTNSLIEYSHDDAMNIKHGYWYNVSGASAVNKTITLAKITSEMKLPVAGDKIQIFNELTFEGHNPTVGYYTVASATEESGKFVVKVTDKISGYSTWGDCRATFISNTPNLLFKNNIVRNKRNRGILIQVPNAVVENNTFTNVGHGSIQAATAMDIYNEATLPQGLTIRNNKFINNNYLKGGTLQGDISVFAISSNNSVAPSGTLSNILIDNNFIAQNGNSSISLRGVDNSVVSNCLFYNASRTQPTGDSYNSIFTFDNAASITIKDSYNYYTLNKGLSGVSTLGTTKESEISLENNNNIAFRVIDDVGAEVDITKASGAITIDGSIIEWSGVGATNIDIIGITDALGTAHTDSEISANFKVNKLMMTYDDTGIYIGVDIFDNDLKVKTINDFWLGDCIEVLASTITDMPTADLKVYKENGGVIQAAFAPTWTSSNYSTIADVRTNSSYVSNKTLLEAKFTTNSTGYVGEIKFPFTLIPDFKTSIDAGKRIDIAIICADCERTGLTRVQEGNVPHNVEDNKTKTARMTQYLFK